MTLYQRGKGVLRFFLHEPVQQIQIACHFHKYIAADRWNPTKFIQGTPAEFTLQHVPRTSYSLNSSPRSPLYFRGGVAQFSHSMTLRFISLLTILLALAGSLRADPTNAALARAVVLENNVAYLRVGQVADNLAMEIQSAQTALAATNKIIGTVLDLRFAAGDDLTVANATTNWFAAKKLPLAILINSETRGAAAALAKDLRAAHDGLVLGGAAAELKPDIAVIVKTADEKQFLDNPYAASATGETNASAATNGNLATFIDHTTEADLVREKIKDGDQDEDSTPARPTEPQKPYIHDPALARAVDLIKALAVIRQSHG